MNWDIPYTIELKENADPYAINVPRRIPLPVWEVAKTELQNMASMGVISEVHHATDWCAPMVIVPKKGTNKVRICVDLSKLNWSVKLLKRNSVKTISGQYIVDNR
jgi:hypothetical protein